MPNYHIPTAVRSQIERAANKLANRMTEQVEEDFPLTHEQVQDLLLPQETVATMEELVGEGIASIVTYERVGLVFFRGNSFLPKLERGCAINVWTPRAFYARKDYSYSYQKPNFDTGVHGNRVVADLSKLDISTYDKLTSWLNLAVRQHRLQTLVSKIITAIIHDTGPELPTTPTVPSVAHLRQLWPTLLTLVDPKNLAGDHIRRSRREAIAHWKERSREETKRVKPYLPKPELLAAYGNFIKVADLVLLQGSMLPAFEPDKTRLQAHVEVWEEFTRDPWCTRVDR
jgi:hypothetical protein